MLNLFSVGAAYGLLVLVFQHDWAEGILQFTSNHSITSWLPMFLFVVLFGLSMDYHVFILSRIKELRDAGMSTEDAVSRGIRRTAGTVTSAAIIMVAVFAIFGTLRLVMMKQLGVGLGVAVLIDATLIRGVMLPTAMKLLGEWDWYMPRWLEWVPSLAAEPQQEQKPPLRPLPALEPLQLRDGDVPVPGTGRPDPATRLGGRYQVPASKPYVFVTPRRAAARGALGSMAPLRTQRGRPDGAAPPAGGARGRGAGAPWRQPPTPPRPRR